MQHRGNGLYRPLLIGQEQRMHSANGAGSSMTLLDEGIELTALVFTQAHGIRLRHRSLLSIGEVTQEDCKTKPR
jgi:hypothetical protein